MIQRILLLVFLAGCAAEHPRSSTAALTAPVVIVPDGDTIPMREAARFGVFDGPEEYQLGDILFMQPLPDGGVLLYDMGAYGEGGTVRSYDSIGGFQRRFGRQGEGPGEYSDGLSGTVLVDGAVMIEDQSLRRITVFEPDGKLRLTVRGPAGMVYEAPATDGGWYVGAVTGQSVGKPREITYFRFSADGSLLDSMLAPDAYLEGPWGNPIEPKAMTIILPDGRMVSSSTDTIAFTIHGETGDTTIARPSDRAAFHPDEKKALNATIRAMMRRGGRTPEDAVIPDLKQAYSWLVSDPQGRIIFWRHTAAHRATPIGELRSNQTPWRINLELDIFDSSGAYLGRLKAMDDVYPNIYALGSRGVWLVHEGPEGEQIVVRWVPERQVW